MNLTFKTYSDPKAVGFQGTVTPLEGEGDWALFITLEGEPMLCVGGHPVAAVPPPPGVVDAAATAP